MLSCRGSLLLEELFHLFREGLFLRVGALGGLVELFEQLLLLPGQLRGNLHDDGDELVFLTPSGGG